MSSQPPHSNGSGSANGNEQDVPRNLAYINPRLFPEIARLVLGENDMPWGWEYDWYGATSQP